MAASAPSSSHFRDDRSLVRRYTFIARNTRVPNGGTVRRRVRRVAGEIASRKTPTSTTGRTLGRVDLKLCKCHNVFADGPTLASNHDGTRPPIKECIQSIPPVS